MKLDFLKTHKISKRVRWDHVLCGMYGDQGWLLKSTAFNDQVTCLNCLKIMNKRKVGKR